LSGGEAKYYPKFTTHHITRVSATSEYVVLGRLSYDWLQLATFVEKERLTKELTEKVQSLEKREQAILRKQKTRRGRAHACRTS